MRVRHCVPAFVAFLALDAAAETTGDVDGLYALIQRRIPSHSSSFNFSLTPNVGVLDSFTLSDGDPLDIENTQIHIQCTSLSACARGLYAYLTDYAGIDIWLTGSRLDMLPCELPPIRTSVTCTSLVKYRYFFNTVTFSYTTAFYTFEDWEHLLDWMALRGVNLPLAWVGYEYILLQVFREAGLDDAAILGFFSGPAFQAWNRFGNIRDSWGGELPIQWIDDQFDIQKRLIPRMIELGMTPVMPSFTGFVPRALSALYPNASIVTGGQWNSFPSRYTHVSFLEPFDPLFLTLQKSFIDKQTAAYGDVSHVYTLDQYNENNPYNGNVSYLHAIASSTFASLRAADPEAIWMMQGWMFFTSEKFWTTERVQAYLGGVPGNDTMIILDLYSEAQPQWQRLAAYHGKQWIWCELHNYGGNMGIEGNFVNVTVAPVSALATAGNSMIGMGLTPEGLEGNEIMYDVLLDQAWSPTPINRTSYISAWVSRRYPVSDLPPTTIYAWQLLGKTVYNNQNPLVQATVKSILELVPALSGLTNRTGYHPTLIFYDTNSSIVPALRTLLDASDASPALAAIPEFRYDLVDLTRQLLANRFVDRYEVLVHVFNASNTTAAAVEAAGSSLLALLSDLDALLCTEPWFRLSGWLDAAHRWAHGNVTYAAYLAYSARNQITLWGPDGEINDYASKQWAGLVGRYYGARWDAFVAYLVDCKRNETAYDAGVVAKLMLEIGERWDASTESDDGETGDALVVARALASKYA